MGGRGVSSSFRSPSHLQSRGRDKLGRPLQLPQASPPPTPTTSAEQSPPQATLTRGRYELQAHRSGKQSLSQPLDSHATTDPTICICYVMCDVNCSSAIISHCLLYLLRSSLGLNIKISFGYKYVCITMSYWF